MMAILSEPTINGLLIVAIMSAILALYCRTLDD